MVRKRFKYFKTFHRCGLEKSLKKLSAKYNGFNEIIQIGAGEDGLCEKFVYKNKVTLDIDSKLSPDYLKDITFDHLNDIGKKNCIFCLEVLEHVNDINSALMNMRNLGGIDSLFILSIPFCFHIHGDPEDFRRYTIHGFKNLLECNDYILIDHVYFGSYISCAFDLILLSPALRYILFPLRFITFFVNHFLPSSINCPSGYLFVAKLKNS
jgi:hypothetical protein